MHQFKSLGVFTYIKNAQTHTHTHHVSSVHIYTQEEVCVHSKSRCVVENKVEEVHHMTSLMEGKFLLYWVYVELDNMETVYK